LSRLLQKDVPFDFKEDCILAWQIEDIAHFSANYTATKLGYALWDHVLC
jgi:hypothetical protein